MISNYFKVFLLVFIFFFSGEANSKNDPNANFKSKELSNYLSAVISYNNQKNEKALNFFKSSKNLLDKHNAYFKKFIFSLVFNQDVERAIQEIKFLKNKERSNFFESQLLLLLDTIKKKDYKKSKLYLENISQFIDEGTFEKVIYETLRSYIFTFEKKKFIPHKSKFGNLTAINRAFLGCYLNDKNTINYFDNLNNSESTDYSRYVFFYVSYLVDQNNLNEAKDILSAVDPLTSSLLILQAKSWIDQNKVKNFKKIFSCQSETDILAEFFFLISNLYSTQYDFEESNFYLNLSNFLNSKFKFNLSLMVENYFIDENYDESLNILNKFNSKDDVYYWYKIKKTSKIILKKNNEDESIKYIEKKFNQIKNPSIKILFDLATIYKNFKNYEKAIELYTKVLKSIDRNSYAYVDLLYRRGSSYERIGKHKKSDQDLLDALEIIPDNSYILNYLAYSWLERDYKINEAIKMLENAYDQNENDPYIIDSVGWGYYLIGKFDDAEKFMRRAVELMPNDPIVNDHYGDILWSLDRKVQAHYFWKNVLKLEKTNEDMKDKIKVKLIWGTKKINENL